MDKKGQSKEISDKQQQLKDIYALFQWHHEEKKWSIHTCLYLNRSGIVLVVSVHIAVGVGGGGGDGGDGSYSSSCCCK